MDLHKEIEKISKRVKGFDPPIDHKTGLFALGIKEDDKGFEVNSAITTTDYHLRKMLISMVKARPDFYDLMGEVLDEADNLGLSPYDKVDIEKLKKKAEETDKKRKAKVKTEDNRKEGDDCDCFICNLRRSMEGAQGDEIENKLNELFGKGRDNLEATLADLLGEDTDALQDYKRVEHLLKRIGRILEKNPVERALFVSYTDSSLMQSINVLGGNTKLVAVGLVKACNTIKVLPSLMVHVLKSYRQEVIKAKDDFKNMMEGFFKVATQKKNPEDIN